MSHSAGPGWLPDFRRALRFLRPHTRTLTWGLIAAVGVGVFYTFSVSSIVPVLKIIFAEHETLADWLNRVEAQRRLEVVLAADVPDDPRGLAIVEVRPRSVNAGVLRRGDRVVLLEDQPGSAFALVRRLAQLETGAAARVRVEGVDGTLREAEVRVRPHAWWWGAAGRVAVLLPAASDARARFATLFAVMTAVVLISALGAVCRFANEGLIAISVQRCMHDLRTALADHTLRLPLQWHSTQAAGDTLGRFATDLAKVEVGIMTLFGKVVREPIKAVGVLGLTLLLDWRMLVVGLIGLPLGVLVIRSFGRLVKQAQRRASQSWGRLLDHLGERLTGIRVVKACNMQAAESRRFAAEGQELTRAQTRIEIIDAASNPVLELLAAVAISAFVLYGGARVFQRELEPHLFLGAVICLGGIFDPLRKMGNVYNRLQAAEASARRVFELIDMPLEELVPTAAARREPAEVESSAPRRAAWETPAGTGEPLAPLQRDIVFEDVHFHYPNRPDHPVLVDINLRVQKGQVVALVGPNGSGKTTLVSLLLRFFEPVRGRILIDGRDIATVPLDSVRAQIGLVTQEAIVFSDTVRANIAYGANGVSDECIAAAARLAHADDFIATLRVEESGRILTSYDAPISGRTLSGGQRQRLVLARAMLRNPSILVLDEATSQVDSESERKIQAALDDVTRHRTTFLVAHRFSTIARADRIVVLNEGRVVGAGTHDELLAGCPFYGRLVQTQFAHAT